MPATAPDTQTILACVRKSLPPGAELSLEKSFGELGLDSLRLSQVIIEIEDNLGLELDDGDVEAVLTSPTLGDMVGEVERVWKRG